MKKHAFICVICILSAFISLFNLVLYAFKGRFVDNNSISKAVETALVVKVLDLSGNPIEDAAVFIVETERVYYTGADGATAEISVPIESGDDWGTVTFAVIKDGFVEYILYNCVVYKNRTRNGPVVRLFECGENSPEITAFSENPPDGYSLQLIEYIKKVIERQRIGEDGL